MFKYSANIVAGASAVLMAVAMVACVPAESEYVEKPEGLYAEQIQAAGLPSLPATEDEIYYLGHEACMARGEGMSKADVVDTFEYTGVADYYDTQQLGTFTDIMYANLCPEFR